MIENLNFTASTQEINPIDGKYATLDQANEVFPGFNEPGQLKEAEVSVDSSVSNAHPVQAHIKFKVKHPLQDQGGSILIALPNDFSYVSNQLKAYNV